jgi:beta-glucosidase
MKPTGGIMPIAIGLTIALLAASCGVLSAKTSEKKGSFADPIERRINDLLKKMTLEEKVGQVTLCGSGDPKLEGYIRNGQAGATTSIRGNATGIRDRINQLQRIAVTETRLHIPIIVGYNVVHGLRTTFPIPLGLGASFDPECCEITSRVSARESRAAGIHWTLAPMIDVGRDARWGRVAEGYGEDPYLTSVMAAAMVKGFQGKNLTDQDAVAACAKHFVAYGACEGGRDYDATDISISTLYNVYLPPYEAAVKAGSQTIMSSFNEIGGMPVTANGDLLTNWLRGKCGFDGFVVSDANSVYELINHGVAGDRADAAEEAIVAGTDLDNGSGCYRENLAELVRSGKLKVSVLDEAVRRVLRIKFRLGLFDHPYTDESLLAKVEHSPEHVTAARRVAEKCMVLLKNDGALLPLSKETKSISVIGPLASDAGAMLGTWAGIGRGEDVVSILDGIKQAVSPNTTVRYVAGCTVPTRYIDVVREAESEKTDGIPEAVEAARQSDVVVVVVGEHCAQSGEAGSRSSIELPGVQEQLLEAVCAVGKPVVVVLANGRALAVPWIADHVPAILEAWHSGDETGHAVASVLFGDYNPGGKLPATFPKGTGFCPEYYDRMTGGRPVGSHPIFSIGYCDTAYAPVFPFGYGLSYTTFEYSNLKIDPGVAKIGCPVHVRANVRNTGKRSGDEVVQLYIRDVVSRVTRPIKELKGFKRITLEPGETKSVEFVLTKKDLEYYDGTGKALLEPGRFKVWVGGSSESGLEGDFLLSGGAGSRESKKVDDVKQNTGYVGGWK